MKLKHTSMIVSALLFGGLASAAHAVQQPNFYECSGRGANLTLSIGSKAEVGIFPAATVLNLELGKKNYSFKEADITVESTLIGELWEVTLEHIPDLRIDHASVVIPQINLGDAPQHFVSQLILTRVATPFTGEPPKGVVNASRYIDLSCSASVVYY